MAIKQNLEKKLSKTVVLQVIYYDLKHLLRIFVVRNFVYLNSKNINKEKEKPVYSSIIKKKKKKYTPV